METIVLPVYYTQEFKTKADKTSLVGMNLYRNAHYFLQNNLKKHYDEIVRHEIKDDEKVVTYMVVYEYFYKSRVSDLSNVCSIISKFFNDTVQALNIVENDNVQFCLLEAFAVGGQDKENPRVEVTLVPINKLQLPTIVNLLKNSSKLPEVVNK